MSASILWRVPKGGKSVPVGLPSRFVATMETVFGSSPWRLSESDAPRLSAMAAAAESNCEAFETLADLAMKHGEVEVWAEY